MKIKVGQVWTITGSTCEITTVYDRRCEFIWDNERHGSYSSHIEFGEMLIKHGWKLDETSTVKLILEKYEDQGR
jgi:hypothetical protein